LPFSDSSRSTISSSSSLASSKSTGASSSITTGSSSNSAGAFFEFLGRRFLKRFDRCFFSRRRVAHVDEVVFRGLTRFRTGRGFRGLGLFELELEARTFLGVKRLHRVEFFRRAATTTTATAAGVVQHFQRVFVRIAGHCRGAGHRLQVFVRRHAIHLKHEHDRPDLERVTRSQFRLLHACAVAIGAVGAAQILDANVVAVLDQPAMFARDVTERDAEVAVFAAADDGHVAHD
jgi:hypothetical protein